MRLKRLSEFIALDGELLPSRSSDGHLSFLWADFLGERGIAKQFGQLPGSEPGKGAARNRLDERVPPVRRYTLQSQGSGVQGLTAPGLDRISSKLANYS